MNKWYDNQPNSTSNPNHEPQEWLELVIPSSPEVDDARAYFRSLVDRYGKETDMVPDPTQHSSWVKTRLCNPVFGTYAGQYGLEVELDNREAHHQTLLVSLLELKKDPGYGKFWSPLRTAAFNYTDGTAVGELPAPGKNHLAPQPDGFLTGLRADAADIVDKSQRRWSKVRRAARKMISL